MAYQPLQPRSLGLARSESNLARVARPLTPSIPSTLPKAQGRCERYQFAVAHCRRADGVGSDAVDDQAVAEKRNGLSDLAFVALCRVAYGRLAGWQSDRSWWDFDETYAGMVEVSRALMKVREVC